MYVIVVRCWKVQSLRLPTASTSLYTREAFGRAVIPATFPPTGGRPMVAPTMTHPTTTLRRRGVHCTSAPAGDGELLEYAIAPAPQRETPRSFRRSETAPPSNTTQPSGSWRSEAPPARETRRKRENRQWIELARIQRRFSPFSIKLPRHPTQPTSKPNAGSLFLS